MRQLHTLLAAWNRAGLPDARVSRLVEALADAGTMADLEFERPGRIAQTAGRMAKRWAKLDDANLNAEWRSAGTDADAGVRVALRRMTQEAAWGAGQNIDDLAGVRSALWLVAEGANLGGKLPPHALEFAKLIGAEPERASRSGPGEGLAQASLAFDLACVFEELTGEAPGFSADGMEPEGSFRAFVAEIDAAFRAEIHPRRHEPIGSERRLREAVASFRRGDRSRL